MIRIWRGYQCIENKSPSIAYCLSFFLRDMSVGPETFARHLKTHLFRAGFSDQARTFEFVLHFVGCVTMSG